MSEEQDTQEQVEVLPSSEDTTSTIADRLDKIPVDKLSAEEINDLEKLKQEIVYVEIDDIKPSPNKARNNDEGVPKVASSIRQCGFRSPIYVDGSTNEIVIGHTRWAAAKKLGLHRVPVVYIFDLSPSKLKLLKLADNRVAEFSGWNFEELNKEIGELKLELPELDFGDLGFGDDDIEKISDEYGEEETDDDYTAYTGKTDVPQYQPSDETPKPAELANREKSDNLVAEINAAEGVPPEVKEFLRLAAMRHVVFDYKKIADFYAAADEKVQELMEKSALVIIDYDNAIKNGFVRHSAKLEAIAKGIFDAKRDE